MRKWHLYKQLAVGQVCHGCSESQGLGGFGGLAAHRPSVSFPSPNSPRSKSKYVKKLGEPSARAEQDLAPLAYLLPSAELSKRTRLGQRPRKSVKPVELKRCRERLAAMLPTETLNKLQSAQCKAHAFYRRRGAACFTAFGSALSSGACKEGLGARAKTSEKQKKRKTSKKL